MSLVDVVAGITGHRFRDEALLRQAFTHASWVHEHPGHAHYERLEFLGDAVVGLCVTRLLYAHFPGEDEGTLNDLRQHLVSARALGQVSGDLRLEALLRKGVGFSDEEAARSKVPSDVLESMLGALFEEAGLDACQRFVDRYVGSRIEELVALVEAEATGAAKSQLQEWTQDRYKETPSYEARQEGPPHAVQWHAKVFVRGAEIADGTGKKKKDAEAAAAHLALTILRKKAAEAS